MNQASNELINLLTLVVLVIGFIAAIPAAIGFWRRGKRQDDAETIESQDRRIRNLEDELGSVKTILDEKERQLVTLGTKLDEVRRQNLDLQAYARLDKVPPALAEALEAVANAHHAQTQRVIADEVGEVRKAVASALADIAMASRSAVDDFTNALERHFPVGGNGAKEDEVAEHP